MLIAGIESSCDECAVAVVEDGKRILSSIVATQIPLHARYDGVVPEIASRAHVEWIRGVASRAFAEAGIAPNRLDGVAATSRPGLLGSLLVGLQFGKGLAWAVGKPFLAVDHMLAHLYAPFLSCDIAHPFLGLLVSGGHSVICVAEAFDRVRVLGTTMDDAVGEAFDKVSKHYGWGYPGGKAIDDLARDGDPLAYAFPKPSLHKGEHGFDLSYSGLKTAAIRQAASFLRPGAEASPANLAASFRKAAIDQVLDRLSRAAEATGLRDIVAGGGVAANSYLRSSLAGMKGLRAFFPPLELCGDNGAMVAGIAYRYFARGESSGLDVLAGARVEAFKRGLRP